MEGEGKIGAKRESMEGRKKRGEPKGKGSWKGDKRDGRVGGKADGGGIYKGEKRENLEGRERVGGAGEKGRGRTSKQREERGGEDESEEENKIR